MDAMLEVGQLVDVAGNRVVLVITPYDLPKPCTDFDNAIMHSALKLILYGSVRQQFYSERPALGMDFPEKCSLCFV